MVPVGATRSEDHRAAPQAAGFALDSRETIAGFNDEVASSVLTEGDVQGKPFCSEGGHDRKKRTVADVLWVLHALPFLRTHRLGRVQN